ncbi:MAG: hypothetical protein JNL47_01905 [Bacteroidia bacterium]|nr:hypothetical protein [Bacteroidia bacterium]
MQDIEPFYAWRDLYIAAEDEFSPFFGREYSEFVYTHTIYNYYIHPQWDDFGSNTLYTKILFVDYERKFTVMEFIGEWNDAINNDIMMLKRDVIDEMLLRGIRHFILIGENVLNFHPSDDCYYSEWQDDTDDGWITAINFRVHVLQEFSKINIDSFLVTGGELNSLNWRNYSPVQLFDKVDSLIRRRLG